MCLHDGDHLQGLVFDTLVATKDGCVPVQDLRATSMPLAAVTSPVLASRTVMLHTDDLQSSATPCYVYGINQEVPFFTAGSVLITSSGYRAVDPKHARLSGYEGQLSRLEPGDIVYRLKEDASGYERVLVRELPRAEHNSRLCALAFESGGPEFHANGFLMLGYQHYVQSRKTADALADLKQSERLSILSVVQEFQAIHRHLGDSVTGQLLQREINSLLRGRRRGGRALRRSVTTVDLAAVDRRFEMKAENPDKLVPSYRLPSVELCHGSVLIDGNAEPRCHFDVKCKSIKWSRSLDDGIHEHGRVDLHNHGLSGAGTVVLSTRDSPSVISEEDTVHPVYVTREKLMINSIEHISSTTHSFTDVNEMVLDLDVWTEKDKDKTEPTRPSRFGKMLLEVSQIEGPDGMKVPMIRLPLLDALCDAINAKFAPSMRTQLSSLYNSSVDLSGQSDSYAIVRLTGAPLLAQLADQDPSISPFGCTFKESLNSDIQLPILFHEFQVSYSDLAIIGPIFAYDPLARGCLGSRHLLRNSTVVPPQSLEHRVRTSSMTTFLESQVRPGIPPSPAPVTTSLSRLNPMSVQSLLELPNYSEVLIHQTSSDLVHQAMLYHMNDRQREELLKAKKPRVPEDLPADLGPKLKSDLALWLANIYAPAYISKILVEMPREQQEGWRRNFTKQERARLEYWWSGKGKTCLAMSQQYSKITAISASSAMILLFPQLTRYQYSGTYWAEKLVNCVSHPDTMRTLFESPINGGTNQVNKTANILATLDGKTGLNTRQFCYQAWGFSIGQTMENPFIDDSTTESQKMLEWLTDSFTRLATHVLDPSATELTMSDRMREDFSKDITTAEVNYGLPSQGSAKARIAALLEAQAPVVEALSQLSSPFADASSPGLSTGTPALTLPSFRQAGKKTWDWASTAIEKVVNSLAPQGSRKMAGLKGIWSFCIIGRYLLDSTNGFSEWSRDTFENKVLIVATIQFAVDVGERTWDIWQGYKIYKSNVVVDAALSAILDEQNVSGVIRFYRLFTSIYDSWIETGIYRKINSYPLPKSGEVPKGTIANVWEKLPIRGEPEELPPALRPVYKAFNAPGRILAGITIVLGIIIVVGMTISLAEDWNDMTTVGQALNIIQIGVTAASIFASELIGEALVWAGFLTAESTMVVSLPIVGAVLAAIGVVIMLLLSLFDFDKKPHEPPLQPVEVFIQDVGQPLIATWADQRGPLLAYTFPPDVPVDGSARTFTVLALNRTTSIMKLRAVTFNFLAGDASSEVAKSSLFSDPRFQMVAGNDVSRGNPGNIFVGHSSGLEALLESNPRGDGGLSWSIRVAGSGDESANPAGLIRLAPGYGLSVNISGYINSVRGISSVVVRESLVEPDDIDYHELDVTKR